MAYENLKAQIAEYNKLCDEKCAKTPERQNLKYNRVYTPVDIEGFDYERDLGMPGEFPYTRGVQPTMYRGRFWTMRMYAGFATAEESNKRYRYLIESGATGLSCAFDLPTQIGYDSDDVMAEGEVGKVGVAIDSLADMEILFDGIDLGKVSTSMTINAPASVLLAMYIAVAEKQGVPSTELKGTIQNDILKEYAARGTYIFPPKPSMRLITNIFEYCSVSSGFTSGFISGSTAKSFSGSTATSLPPGTTGTCVFPFEGENVALGVTVGMGSRVTSPTLTSCGFVAGFLWSKLTGFTGSGL